MSCRKARLPPATVSWRWLALLAMGTAVPVAAQELPFQRDYPGASPFACAEPGRPPVPTADARRQAGQLASSAAQSVLLGELERALAMLDRAIELDPASADLAYRRARVLEDLGQGEAAMEAYCRHLGLVDSGETVDDAQARLQALTEAQMQSVSEEAVAAFRTGLEAVDVGAFEAALDAFETAGAEAPDWPAAVYNIGAVLDRLDRPGESAQGFSRYLDLRPDAPDAIVVSRRIGQLQSLALSEGPSPGTALTLGVLLPGLGHFYSGRPAGGIAVMALAGGAVAAGFLVKEVNVRCLSPSDGACPPDQVVSRTTSRPYLTASLAAAAAVGIAGAIEAFVDARGRRAGAPFSGGGEGARVVALPGLDVHRGRLGVGLLRIRVR